MYYIDSPHKIETIIKQIDSSIFVCANTIITIMQTIFLLVLYMLVVYSSRLFMKFSIKSLQNKGRRLLLEIPRHNITLNITFQEPTITLPKVYLYDEHQVIMLFQ